jgi:hypothetical protein
LIVLTGQAGQQRLEFELVARNRRRGQIPALDPGVLHGARPSALTASASAPEFFVEDVIEASSALGSVELTTLSGAAEHVEFKLPAGLNDSRAALPANGANCTE